MNRWGKARWWVLLAGVGLGLAGCGDEDADRLARLGHKTLDKVHEGTLGEDGPLKKPLDSIRESWPEVTLEARVMARLRWDKDLEGHNLEVRDEGAGVIQLRGVVLDKRQREKAVQLTRSTVGVKDVIDGLVEGKDKK